MVVLERRGEEKVARVRAIRQAWQWQGRVGIRPFRSSSSSQQQAGAPTTRRNNTHNSISISAAAALLRNGQPAHAPQELLHPSTPTIKGAAFLLPRRASSQQRMSSACGGRGWRWRTELLLQEGMWRGPSPSPSRAPSA